MVMVAVSLPRSYAQPTSAAATSLPRPAKAATQPDPTWIQYHNGFLAQAKEGKAQLLFMGDSITRGWRSAADVWEAQFGKFTPVNFGIGGDRTEHVLWRLQNGELDGLSPKLVVLLIGTNNTARMDKPEDTAEGVKAILATIHDKCPAAKVLLLSVLPRGADATDAKRVNNERLNALIAKFDDGKTVKYLDITGKFLAPDGTLVPGAYQKDNLHLDHKGYEIFAEAIAPTIAEMMGK
jgi:lysophospholipase L1-like esterase